MARRKPKIGDYVIINKNLNYYNYPQPITASKGQRGKVVLIYKCGHGGLYFVKMDDSRTLYLHQYFDFRIA